MKREYFYLGAGLFLGMTMASPLAHATAEVFAATPSTQAFVVDGQRVELEAYAIAGHNYVQLRDIGKAVDFNVAYDPSNNTVVMEPDKPYTGADITPQGQPDRTITLPTDGTRYEPQAGDVIRCDDGYLYAITDVSRWDASAFADGPLADLPTPTCDWSLLDQPELPSMEVRHFSLEHGEYMFIRNLYETRRMQYTLYNAIGANEQTWQNGAPVLRKDGTQLVRIELDISGGSDTPGFWPWREELVVERFNSCPAGTFQLAAWDVYKDGVFQRTEYKMQIK